MTDDRTPNDGKRRGKETDRGQPPRTGPSPRTGPTERARRRQTTAAARKAPGAPSSRGRPEGVRLHTEVLEASRKARGLTQRELAIRAGLSLNTVRNAADGKGLSPDNAQALARALHLPYRVLVRLRPEEQQAQIKDQGLDPRLPPARFVGRRTMLRRLTRALTQGPFCRCAVAGLPGTGKTALSALAVHDPAVQARYEGCILWLPSNLQPRSGRVRSVQLEVATALGFSEVLPPCDDDHDDQFQQAFRNHLGRCNALLVFDDLISDEVVEAFVARDQAPSVLITTNQRHLATHFEDSLIELTDLSTEEAQDLLGSYLPRPRLQADPDGLRQLLCVARGIPRILHVAGLVLHREAFTSPGDLAHRIIQNLAELKLPPLRGDPPEVTDRRRSQIASLEYLKEFISTDSWNFLDVLVHFGELPFSLTWAAAAGGLDLDETRHRISELCDVYLVTPAFPVTTPAADQRFRLEGVVLDYLRWRLGPDDKPCPEALLRAAFSEARRLGGLEADRRQREFFAMRSLWTDLLTRLCGPIADGLPGGPEAQARRLRDGEPIPAIAPSPIGELLLLLDDLATQSHLQQARRWLALALLCAPDRLTRGRLGLMLGQQHYPDFSAAHDWFAWAAPILEEQGDLARAAVACTEWGKMCHGTGRVVEALEPLERAYALSLRAGLPPGLTAVRANNLALAHLMLREAAPGRYERALQVLDEALVLVEGGQGYLASVEQVIRTNRALCRVLASGASHHEDETVLASFRAYLPSGSLSAAYPALSFAWVRHGEALFEAEHQTADWARGLWSRAVEEETAVHDRPLRHASCVLANMLALRDAQADAQSGVLPGGMPGTVAIIDAAYDVPGLAENTGSMGLCYLIEPFAHLMDKQLLLQIKNFLDLNYGSEHLATKKAEELLKHAGAATAARPDR